MQLKEVHRNQRNFEILGISVVPDNSNRLTLSLTVSLLLWTMAHRRHYLLTDIKNMFVASFVYQFCLVSVGFTISIYDFEVA